MDVTVDEYERLYHFCHSLGLKLSEEDMRNLSVHSEGAFYIASQKKLFSRVRRHFIKADVLSHGVRIAAIKNKITDVSVYRILSQEKKNVV